jgi:hypothetical protein
LIACDIYNYFWPNETDPDIHITHVLELVMIFFAHVIGFSHLCGVKYIAYKYIVGRDGLTHNMLNDIHNNWKQVEAVRIKCLGVPTIDMKNICTHLEVLLLVIW